MRTLEIKIWMLREGITQTQIARELGVDPTLVSHIIAGRLKGRGIKGYRVLQWLREHGCPEEYLPAEEEVAA